MRYPRAYYEETRWMRGRLTRLASCLHRVLAGRGFRWATDERSLRHGLPNYIRLGDGHGGDSILVYLQGDDTFRLSMPCCAVRLIFPDDEIVEAATVAAEHLKCRPCYTGEKYATTEAIIQ